MRFPYDHWSNLPKGQTIIAAFLGNLNIRRNVGKHAKAKQMYLLTGQGDTKQGFAPKNKGINFQTNYLKQTEKHLGYFIKHSDNNLEFVDTVKTFKLPSMRWLSRMKQIQKPMAGLPIGITGEDQKYIVVKTGYLYSLCPVPSVPKDLSQAQCKAQQKAQFKFWIERFMRPCYFRVQSVKEGLLERNTKYPVVILKYVADGWYSDNSESSKKLTKTQKVQLKEKTLQAYKKGVPQKAPNLNNLKEGLDLLLQPILYKGQLFHPGTVAYEYLTVHQLGTKKFNALKKMRRVSLASNKV